MSVCKKLMVRLSLPEETARRFETFDRLLRQWNEKMDLTAVLEEDEAIDRHYLDSLTGSIFLPENARVIDVGTGAGFPGIPLCLFRPDLEVTLLDAQQKRVSFLQEAIAVLGLRARAVHARCEDFARLEREQYDAAISRAVASTPVLAEWLLPFVKVGGCCVLWKGPAAEAEIQEGGRVAALLGGSGLRVEQAPVPGRDWQHLLVIIEKTEPTPSRFPRKAGMALKRPL